MKHSSFCAFSTFILTQIIITKKLNACSIVANMYELMACSNCCSGFRQQHALAPPVGEVDGDLTNRITADGDYAR